MMGSSQSRRLSRLEMPDRAEPGISARQADLTLLNKAPPGYLDTTHFDTVRFPPPDWAVDCFSSAARDGSLAYTGYRGNGGVLDMVAETTSQLLGINVDAGRNLILTPGTQAGLFCALSSLVEADERVALVDPEYLFSDRILGFLGANVGHIRLTLSDSGPTLDLENLEAEFAERNARILVFSHPNNPTGAIYPKELLERIAALAKAYDVTVLVDELYARLVHDGAAFHHLAAIPEMAERTVTLLGPSKTESLSGYRLGVVVAPPRLIARMENVLSITSLRAPAYAQHVLVPWMRDDHAWLAQRIEQFTALRELTTTKLRQVPWLQIYPQQGTAYMWVDVSQLGLPGPVVAEALLTRSGVLVSPGYQFGPTSGGHFRVCYARDEAQWEKALDAMIEVLNELGAQAGLSGALQK
jgi:aspartate/methionine/tyrosine aminotransferase